MRPSLHDIGCTFLGTNCSQSWADLQLWEMLLNEHPELRSIVELGTGEAGFSRYLHLQAEARGLCFHTFDRIRMDRHRQSGFHKLDIFANPAKVAARLRHPGVLFCDNGDKIREVQVFGPFLEPGDLLAVHDWGTEIFAKHVKEPFVPIHEEWWEHTAIFERT